MCSTGSCAGWLGGCSGCSGCAQALLRYVTLGSSKSGSCSRPATKTEPAKDKSRLRLCWKFMIAINRSVCARWWGHIPMFLSRCASVEKWLSVNCCVSVEDESYNDQLIPQTQRAKPYKISFSRVTSNLSSDYFIVWKVEFTSRVSRIIPMLATVSDFRSKFLPYLVSLGHMTTIGIIGPWIWSSTRLFNVEGRLKATMNPFFRISQWQPRSRQLCHIAAGGTNEIQLISRFSCIEVCRLYWEKPFLNLVGTSSPGNKSSSPAIMGAEELKKQGTDSSYEGRRMTLFE